MKFSELDDKAQGIIIDSFIDSRVIPNTTDTIYICSICGKEAKQYTTISKDIINNHIPQNPEIFDEATHKHMITETKSIIY
jgi:hypothetical protein